MGRLYDHGYVLAEERWPIIRRGRAAEKRLWRIRAVRCCRHRGPSSGRAVLAGNDRVSCWPGGGYVVNWAVSPGDRLWCDQQRRRLPHRDRLKERAGVAGRRPRAGHGALPAQARSQISVRGEAFDQVKGGKRVTGVAIGLQAGEARCGRSPIASPCRRAAAGGYLWSHCGGKLTWDRRHHVPPRSARPPICGSPGHPAGAANGAAAERCRCCRAGVAAVKGGLKSGPRR